LSYFPYYIKNDTEFQQIRWKLKYSNCPHCEKIGYLRLHGFLYGYAEDSSDKIARGHRIFCCNRYFGSKGCGKTFSVLYSNFIKHYSVTAKTLWSGLKRISKTPLTKIFEEKSVSIRATCKLFETELVSTSSAYSIYRNFKMNRSRIRVFLCKKRGPPDNCPASDPHIITILHLQQAFPDSNCPVIAFQEGFGVPFLKANSL